MIQGLIRVTNNFTEKKIDLDDYLVVLQKIPGNL
jgi:hypothetical protein